MNKDIQQKVDAIKDVCKVHELMATDWRIDDIEKYIHKIEATLKEARESSEYWQGIHSQKMDKIEGLEKELEYAKKENDRLLNGWNTQLDQYNELKEAHNYLKEVHEKEQIERVPEGAREAVKSMYDFAKTSQEVYAVDEREDVSMGTRYEARINELESYFKFSGNSPFWNYDDYMYGFYIGLGRALEIMKQERVMKRERAKEFLTDKNKKNA